MRVLVTGAAGFLGRHVIDALLARGHVVTAMTRNGRPDATTPAQALLWVVHDIESSPPDPSLAQHDAVVHLAWPDLPFYDRLSHVERALPSHYRFLKHLVEHGLPQVLVAGTCFEYGLRNGCLVESMEPRPVLPYALAKDCLRKFLHALQSQMPFTLQWARLFYMFGPGQNPRSLIALVDQAISAGMSSFDMTGGEQLRDYLPVQAVAARIVTLLEHPEAQGVTNICSGMPVSVRSLVERHVMEQGSMLRLNLHALPYAAHEPMAFWGDASRLSTLTGRSP